MWHTINEIVGLHYKYVTRKYVNQKTLRNKSTSSIVTLRFDTNAYCNIRFLTGIVHYDIH